MARRRRRGGVARRTGRIRRAARGRRRRRTAARRMRRNRNATNYVFGGTRPTFRGYWRAPRYIGGAYAVHAPQTVVVPYQAPATLIIDNRNAEPRQMVHSQPNSTNLPQTKQIVEQKYTRVKFFNKDILGFELDGAVVTDVVPGGPADDGGVEEGFHAIALNDVQQRPGTLIDALSSAVRPYVIDFCYVPEGWEARWSEEAKRFYFAEHRTQTTSWNLPPILMSKTAVDDVESTQTGRGDDGVFTVKCNITFFPQDTQQQPIISEDKEPGALAIRVSKTTTVESLIQLVEDVQNDLMGDLDYEIDYTSAYSKKGKLNDNAMLVNCIDIDGEQLEVCGHKQPRGPDPAAQCCTVL